MFTGQFYKTGFYVSGLLCAFQGCRLRVLGCQKGENNVCLLSLVLSLRPLIHNTLNHNVHLLLKP